MQFFKKFLRWMARLPNIFAFACRWQSASAAARTLSVAAETSFGAAAVGSVGTNTTVTSAVTIRTFRIGSSWISFSALFLLSGGADSRQGCLQWETGPGDVIKAHVGAAEVGSNAVRNYQSQQSRVKNVPCV